jgi:hypothetical protein
MFEAIYCLDGHSMGRVPGRSPFRTRHIVEDLDEESRRISYCTKCGKPTISSCPNQHCQAMIVVEHERPSYCGACGQPFPWTQAALQAANEYTDELEGVSDADKTMLKETFPDLTVETAKTPLAESRFEKFVKKIGPPAASVLTKILGDVVTAEIKQKWGLG